MLVATTVFNFDKFKVTMPTSISEFNTFSKFAFSINNCFNGSLETLPPANPLIINAKFPILFSETKILSNILFNSSHLVFDKSPSYISSAFMLLHNSKVLSNPLDNNETKLIDPTDVPIIESKSSIFIPISLKYSNCPIV